MKFKAEVITEYDELFFEALQPELKDINTDRSTLNVEKKDNELIFKIQSNDAVSFRAIMASITRLFTINEKLK